MTIFPCAEPLLPPQSVFGGLQQQEAIKREKEQKSISNTL
jgi:hypothetical protein